jgi:hypothetical protein
MRRLSLALALLVLGPSPALRAADPAPAVAGLELGSVTVGKTTFHEVRARSRDARSLFFTHREGLGSVRLRDLPPEVQARLGFDPASAPPEPPPPPRPAPVAPRPAARSAMPVTTPAPSQITPGLDRLFLAYETAPEIRPEQSLQPEFIRLGLSAKNQGRRPSCAIYAIVGALEYQNARLSGSIERLSEDYLLWATRRSLGYTEPTDALLRDPATDELIEDEGFSLFSVVTALQSYGVPLAEEMPRRASDRMRDIPEPSPEIIARARSRRLVFIAPLPGREPPHKIPRIVHALNAGFPVPVGLRWPNERAIQGGTLSGQRPLPNAAHAVTLVGYESRGGRLEETTFVFKNSYGPTWGQGGYGRVTYAYLSRHLLDAYVLDVRGR